MTTSTLPSAELRETGWLRRLNLTVEQVFLAYCVLHMVMALVIHQSQALSTIHGLLAFGLALWWAATKGSLAMIAYSIGYLVAGELLWRMTGARLPWEFGKYAVIAVLGIGILRTRSTRIPLLPLLFILLLLPSVMLTLTAVGLAQARDTLSFNLSGPLTLFMSGWFFSRVRLKREQLRTLLLVLLGPMVTAATITLYVLLTATQLRFTSESNVGLSGGYGPNQVSLILGLGALLVWLYLLVMPASRRFRLFLSALGVWFFLQGVLTFSRGGVTAAAVVMAAVLLLTITTPQQRNRTIVYTVLVLVAGVYLLPQLDEFTQGQLSVRYSENSLSHRDDVINADLEIFLRHPIWGVGPGMATAERQAITGRDLPAHTEFTRMISEHGGLGLAAAVLMGVMLWQRVRANWHSVAARTFVIACLLWALLSMTHAAMRLAAIPVFFGLGYLVILDDAKTADETPNAAQPV